MILTETPRVQNTNILNYATELARLIKSGRVKQHASDAESLINRLTEEFSAHVDEEQAYLLPYLFQHPNERVRATARRSQTHLNEIAPQVRHWSRAWRANRIKNHPDEFYRETQKVFMQLKAQIDEENRQLFPLVEMDK